MKTIDSLRSLSYPPYRRLIIGAFTSNIGTWIEIVAIGIYIQTTTHNATYVALALAVGFIPIALMGLFSGSIADRLPRKKILITTSICAGLISGFLALAVGLDFAHPWLVISMLFLAGFLNAVAFPSWQGFMSDILPPDKVAGGLSLMFAQFNLGRVIGPALAALFVAGGNYALALAVNSLSFIVVIVVICLVRDHHFQKSAADRQAIREASSMGSFTDGWKFIFSDESKMRKTFYAYAITIFWGSPFIALLPNVADEVFKYKNLGTSLFTTAQGIGAVAISVFMTTLHMKFGPTRTQQVFLFTLPFVLVMFGLAPNLILATPVALFFGITYLGTLTSTTLATQLAAPPELKGRVSAVFMSTLGFLFPLGALLQSIFVEHFGARKLFVSTGIILLVLLLMIGTFRKSYHLPEPYKEDALPLETEGATE